MGISMNNVVSRLDGISNTRSVPIYGGQFAGFSGTLKTEFHVIILSEIMAQNLTVGETISSTIRFFVKVPMKIYGNGV